MSQKISEVVVEKVVYPLTKPYVLSFVTLTEFVSVQVTIQLSGGDEKTAEVVPLLGYNDESEEVVLAYLAAQKNKIVGLTLDEARSLLEKDILTVPFSVSPLLTAIDLFSNPVNENWKDITDFVIPTSAEKPNELRDLLAKSLTDDFTLKVKLSGNEQVDIKAMEILGEFELKNKARLDANQAYSIDSARNVFNYIANSPAKDKVLYVEQPLKDQDWKGHQILREEIPEVEVMLDESVVTLEDLERAHDLKINFVKLKLFKQGGIVELLRIIKRADELGIHIILGNGVATSLSNKVEISVFQDNSNRILAPLEANGFLKVK